MKHFAATEHSGRFHVAAVILVVVAGVALHLTNAEWRWAILAFALVWITEALNTAVERLGDAVSPHHNEAIGRAKDVAASAVFIAIVAGIVIGMTIFLPRLAQLLR